MLPGDDSRDEGARDQYGQASDVATSPTVFSSASGAAGSQERLFQPGERGEWFRRGEVLFGDGQAGTPVKGSWVTLEIVPGACGLCQAAVDA
ncbi:hypothetical protein [Streptomyces endocoffeicus]|uniref:hypothetical protein n=1 Tax=Streptomyces endocoffeicus TaxID=2898945 RepID=UPI001E34F712|nr:hypothetical protein [Streptomyces endocoffeicus]